jgi:hypothetical protein
MPRRSEFKSIANDFVAFLTSRSFDVDGYWGISSLSLEAHDKGNSDLKITLSEVAIRHDKLDRYFLIWLRDVMGRRRLPTSWLKGGHLSFHFNTEPTAQIHRQPRSWGEPFRVELVLNTDLGCAYSASAGGHCFRFGTTPFPVQRRIEPQRMSWVRVPP